MVWPYRCATLEGRTLSSSVPETIKYYDNSYTKNYRSGLLVLFERWRNVTEEVQMIMTFQNPLDWASEAFYDSEENENSELERDPEIIFKTYLKELVFPGLSVLIITKVNQ